MWRLLFLGSLFSVGAQETCLSVDEDPYLLFGTKTAYIFGNKNLPTNRIQDIPGCQAVAIWLLSRHGSQNPAAAELPELARLTDLKNNVYSNYKNGNFRSTNQRICSSDLNLLERWEWNPRLNASNAGDLTGDGYMSTQQLAQVWKQKFPGLFTDNQHDYLFKYVNDQPSSTSFKAFTEGLFKSQAEGLDIPKENDEKLLRPYKYCPAWDRSLSENNDSLSQRSIFESKQEYKEMITNVSKRLGFNYDVTRETVLAMYDMCRYNKAWNVGQISPWCAFFTKEDLKLLEYAEELQMYYTYGPGSPLASQLGCATVKDMINFFRKHVENDAPLQPRASVRLGDEADTLLAAAALRLRRAAPLTGDNYRSVTARARNWAVSTISPYNANIAAVLYKCTPNGNFQVNDRYQVLFLENEKPVQLDGCRVGLCDWTRVNDDYGKMADDCDLAVCNSAQRSYAAGLLLLLVFFKSFLI